MKINKQTLLKKIEVLQIQNKLTEGEKMYCNSLFKSRIQLDKKHYQTLYEITKKYKLKPQKYHKPDIKYPKIAPESLKDVMREYQKEGLGFLEVKNGRGIIADQMGLGKELINSTPVLTENGHIEIGDIKVGNRIYGTDGKLHNVTGVFPQGIKSLYRVTFSDDTFADAGLNHLWSVASLNDIRRNKGYRTLSTNELMYDLHQKNKVCKWRIPLTKPVQYPKKDYLINPYVLGVLIADGCLLYSTRYVPGDREVPMLVKERLQDYMKQTEGADYGSSTCYYISYPKKSTNPYTEYIRKIKLDVKGEFKFIPNEYMYGSVEQRKELLGGLLDNDGTVNGARTRYSTASKQLALQICTLVRSLGGIATYSVAKGRLRNRDGKITQELDNYQVNVRVNFNPFFRESNKIKWKQSSKLVKSIKSIEYIKDEEATCISVDAKDKLFLIKDFIVTHNTIQAISYLVLHPEKRPAIIVCPASLKFNWQDEIEKWTNEKSYIINGTKKTNKIHDGINIINYDIISARAIEILTVKPQIMILDESHKIKNRKAKRTKCIMEMSKFIPHFIMLSGTPIENCPWELWTSLNILSNGKWNYYAYIREFCGASKNNQWDCKGASNLDKLNYILLKYYMIRRTKAEVLKELPPKQYTNLKVEIKNRKQYDIIETDFINYFNENVRTITRKDRMAEYVLKINELSKVLIIEKLKIAIDWIENFLESEKQLVIFCKHILPLLELKNHFKKDIELIYGNISLDDRNIYKNKFQNGKLKLIAGNAAMGEGLTLTRASDMLFLEFPYSPMAQHQREDRIHRIGQDESVMIYKLIAKDTIDEDVIAMQKRKLKVINQTLEGKAVKEQVDFDFIFENMKKRRKIENS